MRVLLVEEDLIAARGITLMLKAAGAVVDQTDSGEDALELLRHYEYDIVLLDLALPDIEGFEVVRRMRVSRNDTPVLILSGLTLPQARSRRSASAPTTSLPNHTTRLSCLPACRRSFAAAKVSASQRCASDGWNSISTAGRSWWMAATFT